MYIQPSDHSSLLTVQTKEPLHLYDTVLEKGSGAQNEDTLSTSNKMYIVCDGSTTINRAADDTTAYGGKRAAELVVEIFSENSGSIQSLTRQANERIMRSMRAAGVDIADRETLWATSFAALRFDGECIEWAQSGDCVIILVREGIGAELLTQLPGHDCETLQKWQQQGPRVSGTIDQVMANEIAQVRRGMNRDYGVLNGEMEALDFVKFGYTKIADVTDILLLSDGMLLPSDTPAKQPDIERLVGIYQTQGLIGLKRTIRAIQSTDPRCWRYPRFKMFDDMSGIALKRR